MRNFSSFALALSIAVPLSGCPGDDTSTDDTTTQPTTTSPTGTGEETASPETEGMDTGTGTGPGGDGMFCIHECTADGDCTVDGVDAGFTCQDGTCTGDVQVDPCTTDDECVAQLSGWSFGPPCTAGGGECDATMQICLDVGGEGHCVSGPSEFFMCETAMLEEIMTQDIDGMDVTVCGNPNAACADEGFCYSPCGSDDDCQGAAAPVCNTDTGFCECGEDQHCVDGSVGDVCTDGVCGCSEDSVCENPFDGGTVSCG